MKSLRILPFLLPLAAHADIKAIPHPATPLFYEQTVVWTPLFQAAWDQLKQGTGPVDGVQPPNELITRLEEFKWDVAKTMPAGSWKVWSGPRTEQFVQQVNQEALGITGAKEGPFQMAPHALTRPNIAAFAVLNRELEFERELYRSKTVPIKFKADGKETDVSFFGARHYAQGVRVLSWQPQTKSHALQINSKSGEDSVIVYLPPAREGFDIACPQIKAWLARNVADIPEAEMDPYLHTGDQVRIPYLELGSYARFAPLLRGLIRFKDGTNLEIYQADQSARFKLHERGARVRAEVTVAGMDPFGEMPKPPKPKPPPPPRDFIYDRPFFVFLWKKDADLPYFGAWVGNAEAMELWTGPKVD